MQLSRLFLCGLLLTAGVAANAGATGGGGFPALAARAADPRPPPILAQGFDPMAPRRRPPADAAPAAPPNPDLGNLPDTPGVEDTYYLCTACHSAATFTQLRVSDTRWDYLWDWMIERQGMPEQDAETRETVLSYLKRHFSSER